MNNIKKCFVMFAALVVMVFSIPIVAVAATSVPSIPAETVYSENGITIETKKFEYNKSWGGYYAVDASITNKSAVDVYYEVEYVKVNGFQIPTLTFGDVYSGMTADVEISMDPDNLKLANIEHIMEIEFCIRLSESDNNRNVIDTPIVVIASSDADKYEQSYDFNGQEVYNAGGIRILARLGESNEKFPVLLFVENNSGKTLSFTYDNVAINNKMVIEMMSGGQVISPAIQVVEMNRTLLTMWNDDVPQNKDISVIDFKLSFMPIESDGSFSTGNMYSSGRITLSR